MARRPVMNDKVRKYVIHQMSRKKIFDKRKLYHRCVDKIPICRHMTYRSFVGIVRTIPNIKITNDGFKYVGGNK